MVNMKTSGNIDKQRSNENKDVSANGDTVAGCSSSTGNLNVENRERIYERVNGSSPQTNGHPATNGALPKVNPRPPGCSGGPSGLPNGRPTGESKDSLRNGVGHTAKQADRGDRDSSSDDEECCIYTYRGDADLPSSFFRMDLRLPSGRSSPDMDYLEMDFDPGPANDSPAGSESEGAGASRPEPADWRFPLASAHPMAGDAGASPTPVSPLSTPSPVLQPTQLFPAAQPTPPGPSITQPSSSVVSPSSSSEPLCCCAAKRSQSPTIIDENFNEGDGDMGTVIWKEQEALERQTTPEGPLDSGAAAVINALTALKLACSPAEVRREVGVGRTQNEDDTLTDYLLRRSEGGATHRDVGRVLAAPGRSICARFFPTHPRRHISLAGWLAHWIRQGAVPILSMRSGDADAGSWQHQMVSGVDTLGITLVGPYERWVENALWPALAVPLVAQVRREEVISRWDPETSLQPLADPSLPPAWRTLNVLGQVVGVIREGARGVRSHVTVPSAHQSGVTLAMLTSNPACESLRRAPELPLQPAAAQRVYTDT